MVFKNRIDGFHKCLLLVLLLTIVTVLVLSWVDNEMPLSQKLWLTTLLLFIGGLINWMFRSTTYEITKTDFLYSYGFISGKIPIEKIHQLEVNKTLWVGFNKPATALNGIIVKYNIFDEIYISPEDNEAFVKELLRLNPDLVVNRH